MRLARFAAATLLLMASPVRAQTVEVFAAGSLRGVVGDLGQEAGPKLGIEVKGLFGGSGLMRQRIEAGEKADLLMSADMGSPRKLQSEGRTVLPAIAFAKNRECIVFRKSLGLAAGDLVDGLLKKSVRLKTSRPVADPSGDYAWAIFDKIDALRPGAGEALKAKAKAAMGLTATPTPGQTMQAALFAQDKIDATIVYCSAGLEKQLPDVLASVPVSPALDPHPIYGLAVLSSRPEVMRLALYLLSEPGQALVARNGLTPLTGTDR